MREPRTHEVITSDGVMLRGAVHGSGPSLVFIHGSLGDGDLDWTGVVPRLAERFTCYLPSRRGRGSTDDHPDHRPGRVVEDVIAYVESIPEPTGLVGWSAGATLTLAAAAERSDAVRAVAVFEPPLGPLMDDGEQAARAGAVARMRELVADDRLPAAARAWTEFVFHEQEIATFQAAGYFEAAGNYVPVLLEDIQQAMHSPGVDVADPEVLGRISAPLLVLHGPDTLRFFTAAARHVAEHVTGARFEEIPGAGHAGPLSHPEAVAAALTRFFVAAA